MEQKKKLPLPLLVLIIGIGIGLLFAGFGLFKQFNAKKINEERYQEAYKQSQAKVDAANKRLAEIKEELPPLEDKKTAKQKECNSLNMSDPNWYADKTSCQSEVSKIQSQISDLETEQWKLENADYTVYYDLVKPMSYQIFYIIGGSIAGLAALGAFIIYLVKGKKSY